MNFSSCGKRSRRIRITPISKPGWPRRTISRDKAEAHKLAEEVLDGQAESSAGVICAGAAERGGRRKGEGGSSNWRPVWTATTPSRKCCASWSRSITIPASSTRRAEMAELGRKVEPYDREWLVELARIHAQTNDRAATDCRARRIWCRPMPTISIIASGLAKMLLEGRPERRGGDVCPSGAGDRLPRQGDAGPLREGAAAQDKKDQADRFREIIGK